MQVSRSFPVELEKNTDRNWWPGRERLLLSTTGPKFGSSAPAYKLVVVLGTCNPSAEWCRNRWVPKT